MAKLGPRSVEIVSGMVCSSNLIGSNLDSIDSNTHLWPFLVPEIWTKTTKIKIRPKHKYERGRTYRSTPRASKGRLEGIMGDELLLKSNL